MPLDLSKIFKKKVEKQEGISVKEAEAEAKEIILVAKDEALKIKQEAEEEAMRMRDKVYEAEKRLEEREEQLENRQEKLEEGEEKFAQQEQKLREKNEEVEKLEKEFGEELLKVASLSREEAEEKVLTLLDQELAQEEARRVKESEERVREEADRRAREILVQTLQRVATEHVPELTISTVNLPDESMKGRIIGKEGRNIKAFEAATGVNLTIDETPGVVTLSSYDPVRREIARAALQKLIADGRIQPSRIEEFVQKSKQEIEEMMYKIGEELVYKAQVSNLPREIVALLGRFKFRTSYGQNMIEHTLEVVNIGKLLAAELGANVDIVRKACLLHDLGKAVSSEIEGPHAKVGADLARRYGISEEVVRTFEGHHTDEFPSLEAVIVYLADAISGVRPGARYEDYETYIKRVSDLENIAEGFRGVEKVYAISAGREVRVIVKPAEITDSEMVKLAHDISYQIHEQVQFPGEIKVSVIRETRTSNIARPKQ